MPEQVMTAREAARDILFGSIAGMVAEVLEYPFDLAKVRLQAQLLVSSSSSNTLRFEGPVHCLTQTWKDEGARGLYRGLPAPLVGAITETASLFLVYSAFQNIIRKMSASNSSLSQSHAHATLSVPQLGLAAGGAGFVTSFILTPIELVKCKMQVQMMNFHPLSTAPQIYDAPGRIPWRPLPRFSIYPSSLDGAKQHTTTASHSSSHHIHLHSHTQNSGRITMHGLAYNKASAALASSTSSAAAAHPPGPVTLIRSIIDVYGFRGLWLGHTGTLLRETGSSAAWFVAKEWVARQLVEHRLRNNPRSSGANYTSKVASTPLLAWESALSGAIAGAVGVLLFYPADTVKSVIQTEEELRPKGKAARVAKSTFSGTFRNMYVKHGIKGLYAGCGMTVARAVPSSGIIFVIYDGLSAWFA